MAAFTEAPVSFVASLLGTNDVVIRLLLSLLFGYVLAFFYRAVIQARQPLIHHIYFVICGAALCFFNYGWNIFHSVANIIINYLLIQIAGGTKFSVVAAFLINTTYLVVGYLYEGHQEYDLSWTMPHCVLTLRLISVVLDVYDGKKPQDQLSKEQKESALYKVPTLLEMFGHSYFYAGVLVGPQFDMKRYLTLIHGGFIDKQTGQHRNSMPPVLTWFVLGIMHNPSRLFTTSALCKYSFTCYSRQEFPDVSVAPGIARFLLGIFYLAQLHVVNIFIPDEYFLTDQFRSHNFLVKNVLILIWGKFTINKYIGVWLISEGACIITGLSYNGKDENGNDLWDGCRNVHVKKLESNSYFHDVIAAFNCNTNKWMAKYLFKRLRFLGNKYLSQFITLFYIALWHGIHPGYYMNFMLEFFMVNFETQLKEFLKNSPMFSKIYNNPDLAYVSWFIRKLIIQHAVSYALVSFVLLHVSLWGQVYASVGFCGHILYMGGLPVIYLLNVSMKSSKKSSITDKEDIAKKTE